MILYFNGDNHTLAAQATNMFISAKDDPTQWHLENRAHPDNLAISWGVKLAKLLKMQYETSAVANQANDDIMLSISDWLDAKTNTLGDEIFMVIGWTNDDPIIKDTSKYLNSLGIKHIFFLTNGTNEVCITPTYLDHLKELNIETEFNSKYYGPDAHSAWAKYLLLYIAKQGLL